MISPPDTPVFLARFSEEKMQVFFCCNSGKKNNLICIGLNMSPPTTVILNEYAGHGALGIRLQALPGIEKVE